ncbi:DUF2255 family protein [Agrococcus beijingensis]|uniref:DUF2255 family protein n=1 Tax=Agrococcus beijingensis TaxID=3068634 RepID=UPI0027403B0D|nr:DUF2255 family protein [Agrococcus sp. REN33]
MEIATTAWTKDELDAFERVSEIRVAGARRDGSLRSWRIVWHAVVDGQLLVRSVNGPEAQWYVGVLRQLRGGVAWDGEERDVAFVLDDSLDDELDAAYVARYGNGAPTRRLNAEPARGTTLRVDAR